MGPKEVWASEVQPYKKEFTGVSDTRLQELHGMEYEAVKKTKKMVAPRMSPESKKPLQRCQRVMKSSGSWSWATKSQMDGRLAHRMLQ